MEPILEVVGAVFILAGFVLAQAKRLRTDSLPYLVLNLIGGGLLAGVAAIDGDTGFLLLEGVWTCVSAYSIVRLRWRPQPPPAG